MMDEFGLYNTSLPTLKIDYKDLQGYRRLGSGDEGYVTVYDEKTAIKIFTYFESPLKKSLKFRKIEVLGKIEDPDFMFPKGLVGFEDARKEGYFMDQVIPNDEVKDLWNWPYDGYYDKPRVKSVLIKGDKAMQRIHKKGVYLGDVKRSHIMVDKDWNPKFVDLDNARVGEYGFDVMPYRATFLEETFKKKFSYADIDKYLYAMMSLEFFVHGTEMQYHLYEGYVKELVRLLKVNKEVREVLECIFSDADDKPYIGEILDQIDVETELLEQEGASYLNDKYVCKG